MELIQPLLQYGVLGIFAVLLILFARQAIKREQDRADALQVENARLNLMIQEKTIPTLVEATKAMLATHTLLQSIQYQRDVERAAIDERSERKKQG